jgi:hypothetical protein
MDQRINKYAFAISALALTACGGPVLSGVAVGRVGHSLAAHAQQVPRGAEVCALQDAITSSGAEKPASDTCGKAAKNDLLWRRSLKVLAAYSASLEAMASNKSDENAGAIEAALTGVRSGEWVDVEGAKEKAAREAASKLVAQMSQSRSDLEQAVKDAAPHVKTICDGLGPYLEAQGKGLADAHRDIEKKRSLRTDRRCGSIDGRSVCVAESVVDRMVYANAFGQISLLEASHVDAHNAVAAFCAAHKKLAEAANDGRLGKDATYAEVAEAVKSAPRAMSSFDKGGASKK